MRIGTRCVWLWLLVAVLQVGCWSSPAPVGSTPVPAQQGGLLTKFGDLASRDGEWIVTAQPRANSLVGYVITDAAMGTVYARDGGFSNAMRWFLYWDAQNRLWAYNSDLGPLGVWTHDGAAAFNFQVVQPGNAVVQSMPTLVANALPNSVQRDLGISSE